MVKTTFIPEEKISSVAIREYENTETTSVSIHFESDMLPLSFTVESERDLEKVKELIKETEESE